MAKKNTASGGSGFPSLGWLTGPIIHMAIALGGGYKCRQPGCSGTLDPTLKCKVCGRRGFPRFGSA